MQDPKNEIPLTENQKIIALAVEVVLIKKGETISEFTENEFNLLIKGNLQDYEYESTIIKSSSPLKKYDKLTVLGDFPLAINVRDYN